MKNFYIPKVLALAAVLCFSQQGKAQPGIFKELLLDDGSGHKIHIAPPSGMTNSSPIDWTLPLAGAGNPTPGFVQAGDATNTALQWDNTNKYWQAVPAVGAAGLSGGSTNALAKWSSATSLTNSLIQDDGAKISIANGALLLSGTTGSTPTSGAGTRLMWIPSKAAFRAGATDFSLPAANGSVFWDNDSIGTYSTAFGADTKAIGQYSIAGGYGSSAGGSYSVALGGGASAQSTGSVAIGGGISSGLYSLSGSLGIASGSYSIALGSQCNALNTSSVAIGAHVTADGNLSMVLGNFVSSNAHSGCFAFGDASTSSTTSNTVNNQFLVRAAGGTIIYSNSAASIGVSLGASANSWATVSDSNKKENRILANGEAVLNKISAMWLGSWNYKGQDPKLFRHYGPMAQEFYAAFGHDSVGVSGNDTTLASADVDGINMIAIQALEKRTAQQDTQIKKLEAENATLHKELEAMKQAIVTLASAQRKSSAVEASLK